MKECVVKKIEKKWVPNEALICKNITFELGETCFDTIEPYSYWALA